MVPQAMQLQATGFNERMVWSPGQACVLRSWQTLPWTDVGTLCAFKPRDVFEVKLLAQPVPN